MTEPSQVKALVIQPDGSHEYRMLPTVYPEFGRSFLGQGYLECLHPVPVVVFWFDEESKYKGLPPNLFATNLYYLLGGLPFMGAPLEGAVAITGRHRDEMRDIPPWVDEAVEMIKQAHKS